MRLQAGQLILPTITNDGRSLADIHEKLAKWLINAFGGVTAVPGSGMFNHPEKGLQVEPVYVYTVACEPTQTNYWALRTIAEKIGREAEQDYVYVEYADKRVEIIDVRLDADQRLSDAMPVADENTGVIPLPN
jgi:hypothetical protein